MTRVQTSEPEPRPWYKFFWVWFLITLKASVIIACIVTGVIIYNNPTSMVVDDYYEEGRAINLRLEKVERAIELDIALAAEFTEDQVVVRFISGNVDNGAAIKLNFYHPTLSQRDFQLRLTRAADGAYRGMLPREISGHWRVDVTPFDQSWEVRQNIHLPAPGAIELRPVDYGV